MKISIEINLRPVTNEKYEQIVQNLWFRIVCYHIVDNIDSVINAVDMVGHTF